VTGGLDQAGGRRNVAESATGRAPTKTGERVNTRTSDFDFKGSGQWAVILGGSSGFGLASAKRLARAGLHIVIGHKDRESSAATELHPHFDEIRSQGVELVTHNGNLFEDEERGALLEKIESRAGPGRVHLFLHSIAAGSCRVISDDPGVDGRGKTLEALAQALTEAGAAVTPELLRRAVNVAFHDRGCDHLYTLADTRIPAAADSLTEEDLARTIAMMGYDYLLWGRELHARGLLTPTARLVALTSEGNAVAWRGYAAVSAAKATLESVCRSMALELAPSGVRSYLVQAGITDTPAGAAIPGFDLMKARARLRNPFHRLTRPEDVANAIYALCLPMFDWANGTVIRVDGGEAISGA
jgi:NAD(P)-dependent dehydrogenase (short-subunit alcohol dehydrogenase family)